jgi:glutaconyl-CoA/methylmalonyl-CoA decarboxylase subunit gamma
VKIFKVNVDGQEYTVKVEELAEPLNKVPSAAGSTANAKVYSPTPVKTQGSEKRKEEPADKPRPASGGGFSVKAPMPGSIIEVKVKEGDTVNEGDVLLVLEAMKMENELTAPQSGNVSEVLVKKGDTVNSGDPLITLS